MQEHERESGRIAGIAAAAEAARVSGEAPIVQTVVSAFADELALLRGFIAQPRQVATIVPSSIAVERRLVRAADLTRARTVVELGPGTGGTTRALLDALRPDARLVAIELFPGFHARLVRRFADPRLTVELGSAEQLADVLRTCGAPAPDVVVSGIPFSTMPAGTADRVARTVADCLAPGGRFVAYQVRAHVADFVSPYLGRPTVRWALLNVPPLRVFRWVKGRVPNHT